MSRAKAMSGGPWSEKTRRANPGNAADKFTQIDRYVTWRLKRLLLKKRGRNLRAGQADQWTRQWFYCHDLHRLGGTIRYPKVA